VIEKLANNLAVVDRVEKAEKACLVLVAREMLAVYLRRDATDASAILVGAEDRSFGMEEKRILSRIEPIAQLDVERAHIRRVVSINVRDDAEKVFHVSAHDALADLEHRAGTPLHDLDRPSKGNQEAVIA
jgi:hypothetical protein